MGKGVWDRAHKGLTCLLSLHVHEREREIVAVCIISWFFWVHI